MVSDDSAVLEAIISRRTLSPATHVFAAAAVSQSALFPPPKDQR
jgi:hypothetical protein